MLRNRPDRALFQARAGGILHEVAFLGSQYNTSKNLKGRTLLTFPPHFGFIRDAMLAAVITRLQNPEFKMTAAHISPSAGEEFSLLAERGTEKIAIGVDNQSRPERVRISTATGVDQQSLSMPTISRPTEPPGRRRSKSSPMAGSTASKSNSILWTWSPRFTENDFEDEGQAAGDHGELTGALPGPAQLFRRRF